MSKRDRAEGYDEGALQMSKDTGYWYNPARNPHRSTHEHFWEVEYLPDPTSAGSVVRSGALFCACGATKEDQ